MAPLVRKPKIIINKDSHVSIKKVHLLRFAYITILYGVTAVM